MHPGQADDISFESIDPPINKSRLELERKVNMKIKYVACGSPNSSIIPLEPEQAVNSENFRYTRSVLYECGSIDHDVQAQMNATWAK
ncbi:unnamed protein product [Euphydryas editha]|uniref:Uncharacterized protein n=1 Tax=Euphydryas editha TaxID=104508 RepID=A0AAU9TLW0_EUPED|nr:unnamed protein product [Euphydryas editha]